MIRFLVPAFLAGLLALAIPLWVHLTRKQRSLVVPFPSLMFLSQVPFKEDRRRAIHHWLLLLLRALAVALLVAAFARPFFEGGEAFATTGSGPREVVVLLDRSYSMEAGDRWDRARAAAAEAVSGIGPMDRASLVVFDQGAEAVERSQGDPSRLRAALDTLEPGWGATRYGPGLKLAQAILEDSERPARELVVVSDFQRRGWTGEEGVHLPAGTAIRTVEVSGPPIANVAVADVSLRREAFSGRERVTPIARLVRTGGEEETDVEVTLEVDGRELQRRTIPLPAEGAVNVDLAPFTLAARHTRGTVRVATDALPADDARHFVLSPGRALGVRIYTRPGASAASALYLRRALEISDEGAFDVQVTPWNAGAAEGLDRARVAVLLDLPFPGGGGGQRLRDFVEEGGGLVLATGENGGWGGEVAPWLGARLGPATDRMARGGGRIGRIDYDHPVFQVFKGSRSGDFTAARFFRHRTVESGGDSSVVARFDDGTPALFERSIGKGRVLVWTSTFDALWNDLALQPVFLPFVHQLVRYASGRGETVPWFTTGQVLDVSDARAMTTAGLIEGSEEDLDLEGERVVITPSGGALTLPGGEGPHFLALEEAGFYTMRPPGGEERPLAVAVNVELEESDPATLDPEEMAGALSAGMVGAPQDGGGAPRVELMREDLERRQSLWRLLLLAALVLFAAETLLASRASRAAAPG